jgi:hypothetical protein
MLVKSFSREEYYMSKLEESLVVSLTDLVLILHQKVYSDPSGVAVYSMEEY